MPTPALIALVVLCFAGAAWLFTTGDSGTGSGPSDSTSESNTSSDGSKDSVDGVLSIPEDDDQRDSSSRRDERGRDRIDTDDASRSGDSSDEALPEGLPTILAAVRDRTIALAGASSAAPSGTSSTVKVGKLSIDCSALAAPNRSKAEADLLDRMSELLDRAGAKVTRVDAPPACVDVRLRRARSSDVHLVVRAGSSTEPRTLAGRAEASAAKPSRTSVALAGEIAAANEITKVTPALRGATRELVTQAGAIEQRGGPAVALLEIDLRDRSSSELDELARDIATALAVTLSRADVRHGD